MNRVIVTGATGTIGRALIKVCVEAGYDVLVIVYRKSTRAEELGVHMLDAGFDCFVDGLRFVFVRLER